MGFTSLYPLLNTFAVSLSDRAAANAGFVYFIPVRFTMDSYKTLLRESAFFTSFRISLVRVALGGGLQFIMTILVAFPMSRQVKEFRPRNVYMWFFVYNMMFSGGLIPAYMNISNLGLMNSIWALVLPGAVPIYHTIILMNFFRNIPREMDHAAYIDGAGPWTLLLKVYLPISLPSLATVTLFSVVGHWNEFFDGMIYFNQTSKYPLATYIRSMVIPTDLTRLSPDDIMAWEKISDKTLNSAKIFVCMVPILLVYPFFQRYFVHGIMLGSVKE